MVETNEKLTVNVAFQITLPVEYDENGRRKSVGDLVAPYIDDYMKELQYVAQHNGAHVEPINFPYAEYESLCRTHVEDNQAVQQRVENNMVGRNPAAEQNRNKWLDEQEAECQELYEMSSREFYRLSWKDRDAIKQRRGVIFDNGKWVIDPELAKLARKDRA